MQMAGFVKSPQRNWEIWENYETREKLKISLKSLILDISDKVYMDYDG